MSQQTNDDEEEPVCPECGRRMGWERQLCGKTRCYGPVAIKKGMTVAFRLSNGELATGVVQASFRMTNGSRKWLVRSLDTGSLHVLDVGDLSVSPGIGEGMEAGEIGPDITSKAQWRLAGAKGFLKRKLRHQHTGYKSLPERHHYSKGSTHKVHHD